MHYKQEQNQFVTPNTYDDMEGNVRNFTHIDYDMKQRISFNKEFDVNWETNYRNSLVERILACAAVFCPTIYSDYTIRGDTQLLVEWNVKMLRDPGINVWRLRDLTILTESKANLS